VRSLTSISDCGFQIQKSEPHYLGSYNDIVVPSDFCFQLSAFNFVINHRERGLYGLCGGAYMALVTAVYWLWFAFSPGISSIGTSNFDGYVNYNVLLLLGLLLGLMSRQSRDGFTNPSFVSANSDGLRLLLFCLLPWLLYLIAFRDLRISRVFLFGFVPFLYATLVAMSRYLPSFLARRLFLGRQEDRTVLVGSPKTAAEMQGWLRRKEQFGLRVLGIVCPKSHNGSNSSFRVLGGVDDLMRVVQEFNVTQVMVMDPPDHLALVRDWVTACERLGVRLIILSDLNERFCHAVQIFKDDGLYFFSLRGEPLENPVGRIMKRLLDLAVALLLGVPVLAFTTVVVWVLQRWQSPGPVFIRQVRSGLYRKKFLMFKYRTMHVHNGDQARQATRNDPRIFPAGRLLRRFSIDELPQFINVLRGDMSVVGPRPHLIEHDEVFARVLENYHVRTAVKPGVTGLAQVRGYRGQVSSEDAIRKRIQSDIYYLENWSFALDCSIIARTTVQVVFPPKSAY